MQHFASEDIILIQRAEDGMGLGVGQSDSIPIQSAKCQVPERQVQHA